MGRLTKLIGNLTGRIGKLSVLIGSLSQLVDNVALVQEVTTASSQPWTMSVPAQVLQSSISFANALPPIPVESITQQLRSQSPESTDDANQADSRVQQVDASVADWLSHQVSAELLTHSLGSGHSLAELATAGQEQGQAAAGTVYQSGADTIPNDDQHQEVTRAFQNLAGVDTLADSQVLSKCHC